MDTMRMSRESRKIFDWLQSVANKNNVQGFITPAQIYICDNLIVSYYTQPIINVLKTRIAHTSNRTSKHFTIDYWMPVIQSMLSKNTSALRLDEPQPIDMALVPQFGILSQLMLVDYSLQDAITIQQLCKEFSIEDIRQACKLAKEANVCEIRYVNAILDRERAKKSIEISKINKLGDKIEQSNTKLDKNMIHHTPLDIAMMEYEWNKKQENARLINEFKEKFGI